MGSSDPIGVLLEFVFAPFEVGGAELCEEDTVEREDAAEVREDGVVVRLVEERDVREMDSAGLTIVSVV